MKFTHKQHRFFYNIKGIFRMLTPPFLLPLNFDTDDLEVQKAYIDERVRYYCDFAPNSNLPLSAKVLKDFRFSRKKTVYFFDFWELARYFPQKLKANTFFADCSFCFESPTICKNRPIFEEFDNNHTGFSVKNSVLLNFDKIRHFVFVKDEIPLREKKGVLFWRGGVYQAHRQRFFEACFGKNFCDIGHVGKDEGQNKAWTKPFASLSEHLQHRYICAVEGNDVASNLKWIMSSNSVAVCPKPRYESWFMEGRLVGGEHFVEVADDWSDVAEKLAYYNEHLDELEAIRRNANAYVAQFLDAKREKFVELLTLRRYFELTGQI